VRRETRVSLGVAALHGIRRVSARLGWAGEKSGLSTHPARGSPVVLDVRALNFHHAQIGFPQAERPKLPPGREMV
jgi:hypothetical protein